ncbi:MAG: hypothetical protein JW821_12040 [Deltaproteobacteria bacterium]|nr:hypothetical protein [Deltaproteobacteria bacterium]
MSWDNVATAAKRILAGLCVCCVLLCGTGCSKKSTPEAEAIELAMESFAMSGEKPVKYVIEDLLRGRGDEIKPQGWQAKRKDARTFLVSYTYRVFSFERGTGEKGFFFIVDLNSGSVRNVTGKYQKELEPLSQPFRDEKEIAEELVKGLDESRVNIPAK